MRTNRILPLCLFVLTLLVSLSCNRDRNLWDGELFTSLDNGFVDSEFSAIQNMINTEGRANPDVYGKTSGTQGLFCPDATVTVSATGSGTATMRIDFSSGTNCLDGRLRTGALSAVFTGLWKDAGSQVVITPDNYTVAGYAFSFTQTITVNPRTPDNKLNWTTVIDDAELFHPQNGQISWDAERTTTWIEGEGNTDWSTYAYEITGTATGVNRANRPFTAKITSPLRVNADCSWIVAGEVSLTPQDLETRSINYGQGACDKIAVLTVGTFQQEIALP